MADNYTLFSIEITNLIPEEHAWLADQLVSRREKAEETDDELGFDWEFDPGVAPNSSLVLFAEDSGNNELCCLFIQEFLKRFRPKEAIGFEWAETCSKARPGEFGGGACFITAKKLRWNASGNWLARQFARFEKTGRKTKEK